jgi:signal transduction histidine kinase
MKRDIEQMEKTIHDYLEFARGEDLSLINRVNIGNLLQTIIFECKTPKTEIKLISNAEVYTSISENQFKRAIINFIDNAKKFATYIEIKLIDMQSYLLIEIHDNGPGIEADEMRSVLEPFYCTQHSKSKNLIGSGLGMSISHDIIIRYHGSLTLSKSYMGGLLVTIKLPK